jgi:phage terminase large subunit GpA-like protein
LTQRNDSTWKARHRRLGHCGEKQILAMPNSSNPKALRSFKSCARVQQESFNSHLKTFEIINGRFRHGIEKHKVVFEAVCVILQYQLELTSPLFDV